MSENWEDNRRIKRHLQGPKFLTHSRVTVISHSPGKTSSAAALSWWACTDTPLVWTPRNKPSLVRYCDSNVSFRRPLPSAPCRCTHPARCCQVLDANQVSLQLCQLLEILQPDQAALQLGGYLCHFLQSLCMETEIIRISNVYISGLLSSGYSDCTAYYVLLKKWERNRIL